MPTSEVHYLGELRTEATHVFSSQKIITDAPLDNQGRAEAFSPTDLVATSLASCMMTIMGIVARNHDWSLVGLTAKVTKIMQAQPRKISGITIEFHFPEHTIPSDGLQRLENAARTCPVALSLSSDIEQNITFHW